MGGGGAIQGMNEQIEYNHRLLDRSRSKFKRMRKRLEETKRKRAHIVESELSEAELNKLRKEIRQEIKRSKQRRVIVFCIACVVGIIGTYYLFKVAIFLTETLF